LIFKLKFDICIIIIVYDGLCGFESSDNLHKLAVIIPAFPIISCPTINCQAV
jgi:hypothetical protein